MRKKNIDIRNLNLSGEIPSREDISNPFRHKSYLEFLADNNAIDLRNNHTIEELPNGKIRIIPIDINKRFK